MEKCARCHQRAAVARAVTRPRNPRPTPCMTSSPSPRQRERPRGPLPRPAARALSITPPPPACTSPNDVAAQYLGALPVHWSAPPPPGSPQCPGLGQCPALHSVVHSTASSPCAATAAAAPGPARDSMQGAFRGQALLAGPDAKCPAAPARPGRAAPQTSCVATPARPPVTKPAKRCALCQARRGSTEHAGWT